MVISPLTKPTSNTATRAVHRATEAGQPRSVIRPPMTIGANAEVCETDRSNSPLIMSIVTPRATTPREADSAARALS